MVAWENFGAFKVKCQSKCYSYSTNEVSLFYFLQKNSTSYKRMIQERKFKSIKCNVVEKFNESNKVNVDLIQDVPKASGISKKGYYIFKAIASSFKDHRVKPVFLPNLIDVWKLREKLNEQVDNFIVTFYHVEGAFEGSKGNIMYNEWNDIFIDLEQLQRKIVEFYGITI